MNENTCPFDDAFDDAPALPDSCPVCGYVGKVGWNHTDVPEHMLDWPAEAVEAWEAQQVPFAYCYHCDTNLDG